MVTSRCQGFVASTPAGDFSLPAFSVNVVDTTGCGDVFHGAYTLAITRGMNAMESARFASAAAALCATKLGGRAGIPTSAELEQFLQNASA